MDEPRGGNLDCTRKRMMHFICCRSRSLYTSPYACLLSKIFICCQHRVDIAYQHDKVGIITTSHRYSKEYEQYKTK